MPPPPKNACLHQRLTPVPRAGRPGGCRFAVRPGLAWPPLPPLPNATAHGAATFVHPRWTNPTFFASSAQHPPSPQPKHVASYQTTPAGRRPGGQASALSPAKHCSVQNRSEPRWRLLSSITHPLGSLSRRSPCLPAVGAERGAVLSRPVRDHQPTGLLVLLLLLLGVIGFSAPERGWPKARRPRKPAPP